MGILGLINEKLIAKTDLSAIFQRQREQHEEIDIGASLAVLLVAGPTRISVSVGK